MDQQETTAVTARREALFANGFQPIALEATEIGVRNSGKAPVANGWTTADAVPDFNPRTPNTGMLCRGLRPADIDDEDPARVRIVRAIIEGVAGASAPWRGRDNTAGGVLLYRAAEGEPGKRVIVYEGGKVEFLGAGQQVVVSGMHWTGAEIVWQSGDPMTIARDALPALSETQIDTIAARIAERYGAPAAKTRKPSSKPKADVRNTTVPADAEAALAAIPCDYQRHAWVKLGFAYRAAGGRYANFLAWSKTHPQFQADGGAVYVRTQWRSLATSREIGPATLYAEVFRRAPGWTKPSERGSDYVDPPAVCRRAELGSLVLDEPRPEPDARPNGHDDTDWQGEAMAADAASEPLPLFPDPEAPAPYPLAALGPLHGAVAALAVRARVDPTLAAQSILAVASFATMGHADVETPAALVRPISLNLVTVGESGGGKTSADNEAVTAIRAREEALHAEAEAAWRSYRIARRAHAIAVKRIQADRKLSPAAVATELAKLEEPVPPLSPALIPEDLTTQGLARAWSTMQPCLALFTSEGGGIVKGATMSDELLHGALAFIARVWDGANWTTIRAGKAGDEHGRDVGQVHVHGKRLAVHLMIQPNYVAAFLGNAEMRAQGTLSRFLAAWPASTVGSRAFREPGSGDRSALDAFHVRIGSLLAKPFRVRDRNVLRPGVIRFRKGSAGRAAWIDHYNAVEAELGPSGRLAVVRDVGAKSAEMAARIAAILTLYEDPDAEHVTDAAAVGGCDLARWYLEEARRIAEGSIVDPVLVAAAEVLAWLRGHPEHRTRSGLLVYGPTRLRTKAALDPVLAVLAGHGWIVLPKSGPITVRD